MTPRQRQLARHALGLPNSRGQSYRNRFCAGELDRSQWESMVAAGFAAHGEQVAMFYLTRIGALHALDQGERLCPEDFPAAA